MLYACNVWMAEMLKCPIVVMFKWRRCSNVVFKWLRCSNAQCLQCLNGACAALHYACSVWMADAFRCSMFVVMKWPRCPNALYLYCSNGWRAQLHCSCHVWMAEMSNIITVCKMSVCSNVFVCEMFKCSAIIVAIGVRMWNVLYL